jgi:hypothetical protein
MKMFPLHRTAPVAVSLAIGLLLGAGCATTKETADGPKILLDGDQYVTMDAPIGSHMKRRIKLAEVKEPGIAPTRKDIVTADTDTTILPPTAGEMERAISDRPAGGP